jgi:hypothetical protein
VLSFQTFQILRVVGRGTKKKPKGRKRKKVGFFFSTPQYYPHMQKKKSDQKKKLHELCYVSAKKRKHALKPEAVFFLG